MGKHRLQGELETLVQSDPGMMEKLGGGCSEALCLWDLDEREEWATDSFWRMLGYDLRDARSDEMNWQDAMFRDDLLMIMRALDDHDADSVQVLDKVLRFRHQAGHVLRLRCRGHVIQTKQGASKRFFAVIRDETLLIEQRGLLKRRTEDLELANSLVRDLTRSNSELEQFAYSISHALNEPLRMVSGFAQLLKEDAGDELSEPLTQHLGMVLDGAQRMRKKIDLLLEMSRVAGGLNPMSTVDLGQVVDGVFVEMSSRLLETNTETRMCALPMVHGNFKQLSHVFFQLFDNVLKFSGDQPPLIELAVQPVGALLEVAIRDRGIGFESEKADAVFQIFRRAHSRSDIAGEGVGLTVVKRIINQHGGEVSASSFPGKGTTIRLSLMRPKDPGGSGVPSEELKN